MTRTMKARRATLLLGLGVLVAAGSQRATAESGGIPSPIGQFTNNITGSFALCLNPKSFAFESCSKPGVLVLPFSFNAIGSETRDAIGGCVTRTNVSTPLPPSVQPTNIDDKFHLTLKITNYDPATGVGDESTSGYDGGRCIGAKFNKTGATLTSTGTTHFVVSQDGTRIDGLTTTFKNTTDSIGSFSFNNVDLKQ